MWLPDNFQNSDFLLPCCEGEKRFALDDALKSENHTFHHVEVPFCGLYAEPDKSSANLSQLLYGEPFDLHFSDGDMAYGRSVLDDYVGWVPCSALDAGWPPPSHLVSSLTSPVFSSPDMKQTPLMHVPMASMVSVTGKSENGYIELDCGRWIFARHTCDNPVERSIVDIARDFLAVPYVWGGRTAMGIDCSGLVQIALAMTGKRVHRDSDLQFKTFGEPVDRSDLQAGDIAFFPGHVGIMVDNENILHANATHMAVTIDPLEDVIGWVAKETDKESFLGGKRI